MQLSDPDEEEADTSQQNAEYVIEHLDETEKSEALRNRHFDNDITKREMSLESIGLYQSNIRNEEEMNGSHQES